MPPRGRDLTRECKREKKGEDENKCDSSRRGINGEREREVYNEFVDSQSFAETSLHRPSKIVSLLRAVIIFIYIYLLIRFFPSVDIDISFLQ